MRPEIVLLLVVQVAAFAPANRLSSVSSVRPCHFSSDSVQPYVLRMKLTDEEVQERLAQLGKSRTGIPSEPKAAAGGGELSGVLQEIGLFVGALALFVIALTISLS